MWLFTEDGFFSVVEERRMREHAGKLAVRARVHADLERLFEKYGEWMPDATAISVTPKKVSADYRYRVWVPRQQLATVMAMATLGVDYDNFKSHVRKELGPKREWPLHRIWSIMGDLQKGGPYGSRLRVADAPLLADGADEYVGDRLREAFADDPETLTQVRPYLRGGKTIRGYRQRRRRKGGR